MCFRYITLFLSKKASVLKYLKVRKIHFVLCKMSNSQLMQARLSSLSNFCDGRDNNRINQSGFTSTEPDSILRILAASKVNNDPSGSDNDQSEYSEDDNQKNKSKGSGENVKRKKAATAGRGYVSVVTQRIERMMALIGIIRSNPTFEQEFQMYMTEMTEPLSAKKEIFNLHY